jgi:hypothetical protein
MTSRDGYGNQCSVVGAPLVVCHECGRRKCPQGRDSAPGHDLCDFDCIGYLQGPRPSTLWPGEVCDPLVCIHRSGA